MQQNDGFVSRFERAGASDGPLAGLSFAAKDLFDIRGWPTGAGRPDWGERAAAQHDAFAVEALLRAGATLVGKTHTDELAYSLMGINHYYGAPINPAAPDRAPGGSSSGSASVTAAGLADIGLGSDTGGSVRLPASFCGLYGMRPTHGAIAIDGVTPLAPSYDTVGWFARDADTFAAVGAVFGMAAAPLSDAASLEIVAPVEPWDDADPATSAALQAAGAAIGLDLTPKAALRLTENGLGDWREAFRIHQGWEIWRIHGRWIEAAQPSFGPGVAERFAAAREITDAAAASAHEQREAIQKRLRDILSGNRILAIPTSPGPAPLLAADEGELDAYRRRALELLCIAGHGGLPQISIPLAAVDGAPVGLGLIGSPGEEGKLLGLAQGLAARAA